MTEPSRMPSVKSLAVTTVFVAFGVYVAVDSFRGGDTAWGIAWVVLTSYWTWWLYRGAIMRQRGRTP